MSSSAKPMEVQTLVLYKNELSKSIVEVMAKSAGPLPSFDENMEFGIFNIDPPPHFALEISLA